MEAAFRLRAVAGAVLLTALVAGCKDSGSGANPAAAQDGGDGPGPVPAMSRAAVVKSIGACTLEVYRAFVPVAEELATSAQALAADGADERWLGARTAWQRAMERWQEVEQFQYGPLAREGSTPGGKSIRNHIYSWPFVDRCAVDRELVSQRYKEPDFPTVSLINARGLGAAEYLLFHQGTDNGCAPADPINAGPWTTLASTPDELARRKREYAGVVAADVLRRARELVEAWERERGNFLGQVETAGAGSATYPSAQAALNAQSDALFYLESPAKDLKLGKPIGIKECASATCPGDLESRFALRSKNHLQRNLDGFEKLFAGCGGADPLGFEDLLVATGAGQLAAGIQQRLVAIRASLQGLPGEDLGPPLASDPASVKVVYDAYKAMTDLLRTQFISLLNLQLPKDIQTDND